MKVGHHSAFLRTGLVELGPKVVGNDEQQILAAAGAFRVRCERWGQQENRGRHREREELSEVGKGGGACNCCGNFQKFENGVALQSAVASCRVQYD